MWWKYNRVFSRAPLRAWNRPGVPSRHWRAEKLLAPGSRGCAHARRTHPPRTPLSYIPSTTSFSFLHKLALHYSVTWSFAFFLVEGVYLQGNIPTALKTFFNLHLEFNITLIRHYLSISRYEHLKQLQNHISTPTALLTINSVDNEVYRIGGLPNWHFEKFLTQQQHHRR